jgi:hypothetical protein
MRDGCYQDEGVRETVNREEIRTNGIFLTYDYPERVEGDLTQTLCSYMIQLLGLMSWIVIR